MENKITLDYSKSLSFFSEKEIENMAYQTAIAHDMLHNKKGPGSDYLGWVNLPNEYDKEEFNRVLKAAENIKRTSDILIIIGIGGSYLGARAAIEALSHPFYNLLPQEKRKGSQIIFAGNNISSNYLSGIFDIIEGKDISVNVISKSGTTTEPAIAFRIFKEYLEEKYGVDEARKRIFVTTDKEKGALKTLANKEGYETFVIPDNIGGRYSILTSVGLLPIAACGIDIQKIMDGAGDACIDLNNKDINSNPCYKYAAIRNILYRKGKTTEILVNYEPNLHYFSEWWKQLYGESEGKDGKGIFPAAVDFSSDLHSMGQYIQEGLRNIYETVLNIEKPSVDIEIKEDKENIDGLNFLTGKTMDFINKKAFQGTVLAHIDGGVPNLILNVPEINEYYFGYLIYFFEKACGISGYLLGVNPFDQPGVEAYKKNMFALLGKPGYEKEKERLENRL